MVFEKVIKIIKEEKKLAANINLKRDTTFNALDVDSVDMVEIILNCQETFNLKILDYDTENIKTVNDLILFIENNNK